MSPVRAAVTAEALSGRQARCGCGKLTPSREDLAFFEFRGEGSRMAVESCKHCRYAEVAHTPEVQGRNKHVCDHFEPMGPWEFDSWYCGHSGWN